MLGAELGHGIVGNFGEVVGDRAFGDVLDWWVGQRDNLAIVVADRVHVLEAHVDVEQLAHTAQALAHVAKLGRAALELGKKAIGEDVGVEVDDHMRFLVRRGARG